jgi:serine/threonine protein kinase
VSLEQGTRIGPYEVLGSLGAGGMGEVCRARDTKLGRDVALKVLPDAFATNPERMSRFQREAQLLAALNHPNIAAIYGLEDGGPRSAIVMELVEGGTLACPLPIDDALRIAKQIAEAIEYAHDRGIIHRDLKPANIKVTPEGTVKVLDFGLAKAMDDVSDTMANIAGSMSPTLSLGATYAGVIMGTAAYMAPEQAKGRPADRRSDVWAFGIVLYEMLTGHRMFGGDSVPETLASVMKDPITFGKLPDDTPPSIRKLASRCLERDPKRRLQSIGEARIVIEDAIAGRGDRRDRVGKAITITIDQPVVMDRGGGRCAGGGRHTGVGLHAAFSSRSGGDAFHHIAGRRHEAHLGRPERVSSRGLTQRALRHLGRRRAGARTDALGQSA